MPYYKYKDHNIFYEDQGSGPCLFFVHEWNSSSLSFRKLNLKYLVKKLRVICIDLPGYGYSEFVEGLQFDDFSNILIELIDYLKIQKCSLMGFCLGSTIILNFYQKFPERVKFLILIEPILKFPKILIPLLIPRFGVSVFKYVARHRLIFSLIGSQLIGADKSLNTHIFNGIGRNDPKISKLYLQLLFKKNNHYDFHTLNFDTQKNCICILGENTILLFKKNAAYLLNHFNIQNCFVLNGTRHFALIEQPVEISNIIFKYLT
ncbi:MAG: alpha/beta hydrolase [Bacteroidales bacterium]|nr:alpha/beta hydrolase [Bacteroidales bacterium]